MIPRCFTCRNFKSEGEYGTCTLFRLPCDGFRYCASHDKLPPVKNKKKAKVTYSPIVKPVEEKKPSPSRRAVSIHKKTQESLDFTKKPILYMRKKGSDKEIKIEDFEILSLWDISKEKALYHAKYGGEVKNMIFINRILKRGILVKRSNGDTSRYTNIDEASKKENLSVMQINRCINDNRPDLKGRMFSRVWYEEDVPYKEVPKKG